MTEIYYWNIQSSINQTLLKIFNVYVSCIYTWNDIPRKKTSHNGSSANRLTQCD